MLWFLLLSIPAAVLVIVYLAVQVPLQSLDDAGKLDWYHRWRWSRLEKRTKGTN